MREYGYLFLLLTHNDTRARRVLDGCRRRLAAADRSIIAHRYSTRQRTEAYEVGLDPQEFAARRDYGCLVLDWEQGGHSFGLGVEIDRWLDGGLNVIARADAQVLKAAEQRYGRYLRPVLSSKGSGSSWANRLFGQGSEGQLRQLGLALDGTGEQRQVVPSLRIEGEIAGSIRQLMQWLRCEEPPLFE